MIWCQYAKENKKQLAVPHYNGHCTGRYIPLWYIVHSQVTGRKWKEYADMRYLLQNDRKILYAMFPIYTDHYSMYSSKVADSELCFQDITS